MSLLVDILTGKLFSFKTAIGVDINSGTSTKLIVTPKSIKDSYLGTLDLTNLQEPIATLKFGIDSTVSTQSSSFITGAQYQMTPDTGDGYFLTGRSNTFSARLFVWAKVDSGVTGEVCLIDVSTNTVVAGSTILVTNASYQVLKSNTFNLSAGKVYTYGIRRINGGLLSGAYIRAALVTMKIPKL